MELTVVFVGGPRTYGALFESSRVAATTLLVLLAAGLGCSEPESPTFAPKASQDL